MPQNPTYEELLQKVKALEEEKSAWQKSSAVEQTDLSVKKMEPVKNNEDCLGESENLGSIINVEKLQSIMDDFHHLTGMVTAILDLNGSVIEATGWRDICTKFHRIHPKTAQNCTESDLYLAKNITPGQYIQYQCKNGLWDVVTPLYIGDKHLGNIYTGQFFYDEDTVDEQRFVRQAEEYGFDKDAYLDALHRVPRYSRDVIDHLMSFLVQFTSYISHVGLANVKLEMEVKERMRAEEMLQKAHDDLERRVRERTLDLQKTHIQLLHAEKLSAIGRLSASIAHEFNNPLQGIMNIIKGVRKRSSLDQEDANLMDLALTECVRMRDLIKNLQEFNQPSSGSLALVDIHALIDNLLLLGRKEYETRNIAIEKRYAANLSLVKVVADQMKQVLLNLLNNASDACERGGTITIGTEAHAEQVVIFVRDTGTGIAPEHIEHIFEPFFSTKPEGKGTGLGLSVSYGVIQAHGGEINVESEVGKGSRFSISLPR